MGIAKFTENSVSKKLEGVRLKSWHDVEALFAKHLIPSGYGPKRQPIYLQSDIDELLERMNLRLPEDL